MLKADCVLCLVKCLKGMVANWPVLSVESSLLEMRDAYEICLFAVDRFAGTQGCLGSFGSL